tara:strand:- start:76 stop:624 length:549 start_codon:yes stop_codon:yes gene_type:complete
MKTKLVTLLIATLGLIWSAEAKVSYGDRTLNEIHIQGIKGFLYDVVTDNPRRDLVVQLKPKFTRAIVWLDESFASRQEFKIKELAATNENAEIVAEAIKHISNVAQGNSTLPAEATLERWVSLGQRVIANYTERTITREDGRVETIVDYELSLREATQNLIYHYNDENEEDIALPLFLQNNS